MSKLIKTDDIELLEIAVALGFKVYEKTNLYLSNTYLEMDPKERGFCDSGQFSYAYTEA